MIKIKPLITALAILLLAAFTSDNYPTVFKDQLEKSGMTFEMPKGFIETAIVNNKQMSYDYAIKHTSKSFEVRFALRPLNDLIKSYTELEKNKKAGDINLNPNKLYQTSLQAIVMNLTGGQMPQFSQFPKQAVNDEFKADWGATTFFEVGKEFGKSYKYCMVVAIHKDNVADAYYFYLSDKQETISELIEPIFHILKFK